MSSMCFFSTPAGEIDLLTKCPLCHRKSKDAKISTFTEESQLLKLLSGFKTHPCKNLKNGCHEEIPAKLDTLKAHDQSYILKNGSLSQYDFRRNLHFQGS